ncbi:ABC transporter ATP-binding protein [Streptomyces sp. GZWMJZ-114]|uniref:ABC transporter ATP-binding protein n=1 Tax=Streptomyces sp. GZWMJZ-114 TaxID=2494734 RepID=UPI0010133849|nr:ABC transporter ATP-binding protein [Streptomyces sp. GZWMJZ-114]
MPRTTAPAPSADARSASAVAPPSSLEARALHLGYARRSVVAGVSTALPTGKVTMIVGPNACGKSTLLRGLARLLSPTAGDVLLDGEDIHSVPSREVAARLGILPQTPVAPDGIRVLDLVGRGRYPHQGLFRRWSTEDDTAVAEALAATDTLDLADRPVDELSGGQRQRVWIAVALAQRTGILLLDEPTTYLDLPHQVDVLDLVTDLNRERGTTVVAVLHDLNLACRYGDHLIALREGRVVAEGAPAEVVTEDLVREVFAMDCRVVPDPVSGTPLVLPIGRHFSRTG